MSQPIKTSIVGSGWAARAFHVPLVLAHSSFFQLFSVVERSPPSDKPEGTIAHAFNIKTKLVNRYEDVTDDPEVELVIVGTPPPTHYEIAKRALEAGKHVLVDKPITTTYAEAKDLEQLAKAKGVVLYAFQNRRWDADYLTLKQVIKEGSLGHISDFENHFDRFSKSIRKAWKTTAAPGVGLIFDLGPHLIDQALDLFGVPQKITAFLQNIRGIGDAAVDDTFTVLLHYDRTATNPYPLTATLKAHSLSLRSPQLKFVVRGDNGTFVKYGMDVQEDQVAAHGRAAFDLADYGVDPNDAEVEYLKDGVGTKERIKNHRGDYRALYRNLHASISESAEQAVKWHESAHVLLVIELAVQSAKEGRTVDVPTGLA